MAAPAPLPLSVSEQKELPNTSSVPIPPKLPDTLVNRHKIDRFFVNIKQKSHGKQWIVSCLQKKGLIEIDSGFLPHPKCIFYWCQREYAYHDSDLFCDAQDHPCISFIKCQDIVCEKSKFASTLYAYYGNDAWKITPMTFELTFDETNQKWIISEQIKALIASKDKKHVWITKTSFGSLGSGVFLYRGNTVQSFAHFIHSKYKPQKWGQSLAKMGFRNTTDINFKFIVLQEYIDRPLLFNEYYKFDLRVYSLIAVTNPCILFFHIGKMRVCGVKYKSDANIMNDEEDTYKYGHISNCKIQRGHDAYDHSSSAIDGQTMLRDWAGFVQFMYDIALKKKQFKRDWFETYQNHIAAMTVADMAHLINVKMVRLFEYLFSAAKDSFDNDSVQRNRPCQFLFNGGDVMIDENGRFYLLEVNRCPSLSLVGFESIREMTKKMLKEMIDICLEIRDLKRKNIGVVDQNTPLTSVHYWIKCKLDYDARNSAAVIINRVDSMIRDLEQFLAK